MMPKADYEKALSREYGFPVFLTDSEYEKLQVSKPHPVDNSPDTRTYQDPFQYMGDARAQKDAEAPMLGERAAAAHASAYFKPEPAPEPPAIDPVDGYHMSLMDAFNHKLGAQGAVTAAKKGY